MSYHKFRCQVCFTSIETEEVPEFCPVCGVYTGDQLKFQSGGSDIKESHAPEISDQR